MHYAESAFFDGNHCAHVAARDEFRRLARIRATALKTIERRTSRR